MPMINANNANLYYELHGSGKPVILIAGYTCDYSTWGLIIEEMSKHFQVLIFDNRAIGRTTDNNETLTAELMARDVMALAELLQLEHPHIVGQSMGGTIAQTIAIFFPDKIDSLCLLNTSAKWRHAMLYGLKSLLTMRQNNLDFNMIFEATYPWLFGENFLKNNQTIEQFKKIILDNPYPQSVNDQARQFHALESFDVSAKLKNITSHTLIINGKQDLISLPEESHYLASQISQSRLIEFNCAHGIMLEQPRELAETLIYFLLKTDNQ